MFQEDGYQALQTRLPAEADALVLIDPPFAEADEASRIVESMASLVRRRATDVFAVWYPVTERFEVARFHRVLAASAPGSATIGEIMVAPDSAGLKG